VVVGGTVCRVVPVRDGDERGVADLERETGGGCESAFGLSLDDVRDVGVVVQLAVEDRGHELEERLVRREGEDLGLGVRATVEHVVEVGSDAAGFGADTGDEELGVRVVAGDTLGVEEELVVLLDLGDERLDLVRPEAPVRGVETVDPVDDWDGGDPYVSLLDEAPVSEVSRESSFSCWLSSVSSGMASKSSERGVSRISRR
jgi:hypothetical protein